MNSKASAQNLIPGLAIEKMRKAGSIRKIEDGEQFIRQGEFDESIFLIESGIVEVQKYGRAVATLNTGDFVGEISFIDHRPRTASVVAKGPVTLLEIERPDLLRALGEDPDLLLNFLHAVEQLRLGHLESDPRADVEAFLEQVAQEAISHRAVHHPYLLALRDKDLPDVEWALADFARQYHGYSAHFPRYLTTVIGRLELPEHRNALMANLTEESGMYEEEDIEKLREIGVEREWIEGVPHPMLFRRFCNAVGVEDSDPDDDALEVVCWREMFLSILSGGSAAEAVGALGLGTENVVSTMYQYFLPALETLDVPKSETVFFPLHAAVDDRHQKTLLDISRHFSRTPESRLDLLKGMRKALALRAGFWDWMLLRARTGGRCDDGATVRIWTRHVAGSR